MALALFRCDASPAIGAGHVMRCLATAETLAWASWDVGFMSAQGTRETAPALARTGFEVRDSESSAMGADVIVFDHYGLDATAEHRIAGSVPLRIAFDDIPVRSHDVDLLVDPTPGRAADAYSALTRADTQLLAGASYAQLRRSWQAARAAALKARTGKASRILVSMGATDPTNATAKVLAALASLGRKLEIDVVLGPGAPHRIAVNEMVGALGRLHIDPADLPRLVAEADLAIGAAGSSCFERACLGLPAIIVVLADNQVDLARAFAAAGAARAVPHSALDDPAELARVIADLLDDGDARDRMSECAAALVDGRGPQRLLMRFAGECAAAAGRVRLRAAEPGDQDWLLDLQSRPETRRFARTSRIPTASEHAAWMDRTLSDPDRLLALIDFNDVPAGVIRLDRLSQDKPAFEVSIAIAPERHGRGIGAAALTLVRNLVPKADLVATVLAGNQASQLLFERAGYRREAEGRFRSVIA